MLSSYPYKFIMNEPSHQDYLIGTAIYTFHSTKSNLTYLVRVEHYKMDVYIIKFFLKNNDQKECHSERSEETKFEKANLVSIY